ncbi:MAG: hypothetical protein WDO15_04835 [Bacteroidota bacterium]
MSLLSDKQLVRLCLDELCEKMGYATGQKISQSDLEHLCYLIEENTKTVISLSTIRRVFTEKFGKAAATLYAGCPNEIHWIFGLAGFQDKKVKFNQGAHNRCQ